ncbi:MAG: transposase [Nitrospirae bacterium RBG_16_64_22]|nr:MAG: transposase [Nitrospirae bacterium RBG_16_64_22]
MPRQARIDAPGALHHIIVRGIERRRIFLDPADYDAFLQRLSRVLAEASTPCYAWALMPNHFHLLLRTGQAPLSAVMRRLLTGYAVEFNRRHRRTGHLFQNRYKSVLCQEDPYLLELVRYIHLNPLRGRVVETLADLGKHPYCGHGAVLGKVRRDWQETRYVLGLFSKDLGEARRRYARFVQEGEKQGRRPELTGGGLRRSLKGWVESGARRKGTRVMSDERILGEGDFVLETLRAAEEAMTRRSALRRKGYNLKRILRRVCELFSLGTEELFSPQRTRRVANARSLFCYWAVGELGESGASVARLLGVTQPAVSIAARRGKAVAQEGRYRLEA